MNWKKILWGIAKSVFILLFKILLLCVYLVSSLIEVILKNTNEYLKRHL